MSHEPKRIATLDFETDPFKHGRFPRAFAVGFFDGSCYRHRWGSHASVLHWAVDRCRRYPGLVYAHNGGKFDFLAFLLARAGETVWGEPVHCIAGRIVRLRFGEAELRDSYAILPAPLRSYDKGEIDYRWLESTERDNHRAAILDYLRRDVISLHSLVTSFIELHGTKPLTAASAGMRYAKQLGITVKTLTDSKDAHFRQWYFGGLVLARKPGMHRGRFTLYDIKSAYPYAMLHGHPASDEFHFESRPKKPVRGCDFVLVRGTADCFLRRAKEGNKYGGSGEFFVTGWEYLQALRDGTFRGKVVLVERCAETVDFKPYVNHFFDAKQSAESSGDKAGRLIAKIMLNSLYGKFAQRNDRFRDYFLMPSSEPLVEGFTLEAEFDAAQLAVWSKPSPGGNLYNVATAASITGFVRAMLMKAIYETDAYYCDTDSVISDGNHQIKTGDTLGTWGVEATGDLLYIAGKKLYALRTFISNEGESRKKGLFWHARRGWKIASKGCRLTPDEMKQLCQGKSIHYQNDAPCYSLLNSPFFVKRTIRATAIPAVAR